MKCVYNDTKDFPKHLSGKNKGKIDWENVMGCKFGFYDNNIYYEFTMIKKVGSKVTVKCNGNYKITTTNSIQKGLFQNLLKDEGGFKYNTNTKIKNDKRDFTITDRIKKKTRDGINRKYYKYKCNKCGFDCGEHYKNGDLIDEYWVNEDGIIRGFECACCSNSPRIVVPHINSIVAKEETHWMIPYFQGGYDEAKTHLKSENKKIEMKCPYCGKIKNHSINKLDGYKTIGCICGDGKSYPEKLLANILEQLKVEYQIEYSPKWIGKKRYDFYIPSLNCVIETHGSQHYKETIGMFSNESLDKRKYNDKIKKELALQNGIKYYIELDCRQSNLEFIKNSILNSSMIYMFDLSKIDWYKCEEFATGNLIKIICDYWDNKEEWETTTHLSDRFKMSSNNIVIYLKKGTKLGWCNYDAKKEKIKNGKRNYENRVLEAVEIFKNGNSLGVFECAKLLSDKSLESIGEYIPTHIIYSRLNIKNKLYNKKYKNYTFKKYQKHLQIIKN